MNNPDADNVYRKNIVHKIPDINSGGKFWFVLLISYLFVDLNQIQLIVKPLALIRPGAIVTVLLGVYVLSNWSTLVKPRLSVQFKLTLMFVVLMFALVPFAQNNYKAYKAATIIFFMLPFLISINALIITKERFVKFIVSIQFVLLILSVYSLSHGGKGPGGVMDDENDLSLFIVLALPFTFFLYNQAKRIGWKLFYGVIIICSLLAIVNAFSRGGFVGLIAMLFVFWSFSKKKMASLLAIAMMFGVLYLSGGNSYFDEMKTVTDTQESTANVRILSWTAGWRMFIDNPFGVGGNNFPVRFPEYQPEELRRNMWGRVAHSLWFTLIPELGILGILVYGSIILKNIKDILFLIGLRKIVPAFGGNSFFPELGKAFTASFIGFFAAASFISVLYYSHFWYLSFLLGSVAIFAHKKID